ncbi:MAG: GvpL/GvpF family gas vesicle protein [Myxococcota bacterium]|jgi:hypothetical protein
MKQFIYAVIDHNCGMPALAQYSAGGIDGAPLEAICYRDLAAVVSNVGSGRFDPDPNDLSLAQREDRLKPDMLRYQQVNAFLLGQCRQGGMLPMSFGLTAKDKDEVQAVLERTYILLRSYIERLKGKAELVVQASLDLPGILRKIAGEKPHLLSADPVQTGKNLFEAAEADKARFIDEIHAGLLPLSCDFSDGPLKGPEMAINRSYLVSSEMEPSFDLAVDTLGTLHDGCLAYRYIGPLPCYSFANIELNQGNFPLVDKARRALQLPEKASWDLVRSSYRTLIMTNHPDRNPDNPLAAGFCRELVASYEVVFAYCRSFGEPGKMDEYSFAREAVEKAFILDTKGTD